MSSPNLKRIAFLLGAGASVPAGMPKTDTITDKILSGEGVARHSDETYYFGESMYSHLGMPDEYVPRVVAFLKRLEIEIAFYYLSSQTGRLTNYEDLHYLASQIHDAMTGEFDNPAIQALIERIFPSIFFLLVGKEYRNELELIGLAREAVKYIEDVVIGLLYENSEPSLDKHLAFLKNAWEDREILMEGIFTTNHDTVLENFFEGKIEFTDGFNEPEEGEQYWNPNLLAANSHKIRLFKLHGSMNWWFNPGGNASPPSVMKLSSEAAMDKWRHLNQRVILVGTFNKMLKYSSGIFLDLFGQFWQSLCKIQCLIISGYSFGDKGINNAIIAWNNSSPQHKIVVIHPEPDELRQSARPAIRRELDKSEEDNWIKRKRLIFIPKKIECVSWEEIKGKLL